MQISRQSRPASLRMLCKAASLSPALLAGLSGFAQAQEAGGTVLSFGIEQGLYWKDNPDLDIPSTGSEISSRTALSFGFVNETRNQRFAFNTKGTLVAGDSTYTGLVSPSANLSYSRSSASTTLEVAAFVTETDVSALDYLSGVDSTGTAVTLAVSGSGTQRKTGANAKLTFGQDSILGGSFSLAATKTEYVDTTDTSLIDNRRNTAQLSLRADLNEVTTATLGLTGSQLKEQATPTETSSSVSLGVSYARPNGSYTATIGTANSSSGSRQSLRFGRALDLPTGKLSASLGVAHLATGTTQAIGALDWQQDFARGALSFGLSRDVTNNDSNAETRVSRLTMSYSQALTETLGLSLSASLQDSIDTASSLATTTTNISASLKKDLTEDWGMTLGANYRVSDKDSTGRADSSTVYLSIGRNFEFRP